MLGMMRANNYISDRDYALAREAPVAVAVGTSTSVEAPYFVDMVDDALQAKFQDADFQSNAFRVYTTLDMRLQRAAAEAIRLGMANVDDQIKKQRRFRGQTPPEPQVRAGGHRPAYRRGPCACRRTQLWDEPAQPYSGEAPARLDL